MKIQTTGGDVLGQLSLVEYHANRTYFSGEIMPPKHHNLTARTGGIEAPLRVGDSGRFEIIFPGRVERLTLSSQTHESHVRGISRLRFSLHHLAMFPKFCAATIRAMPFLKRWFIDGDQTAREELKAVLGLIRHGGASILSDTLFSNEVVTEAGNHRIEPVVIIVPIYNGLDVLKKCLEHIQNHTHADAQLVLIDDKSPDPLLFPYLESWIKQLPELWRERVTLIQNEENLGFIGSVNRGLSLANGRDVILLNSDALVPHDWVERLMAPIWSDREIASVTPFSNDAELMTTPAICAPTSISPCAAKAADDTAARLSDDAGIHEVIVGVGFCIGLNRDALAKVPMLDTAFGRGYAEEVDWCLKATQKGFRHVANGKLFVAHVGAVSFTSDMKAALIAQNSKIIARRFPRFDADVQDFIALDPMATPRLAMGLSIASENAPDGLRVFIAHTLGGGAQMDMERRIKAEIEQRGGAVVVRVGGRALWQIELHVDGAITQGTTQSDKTVAALLSLLKTPVIVYSCGVGHPDPCALTQHILDWAATTEAQIEVLMHDYFPISPSYTLLGNDRFFTGVPLGKNTPQGHDFFRHDADPISLKTWQKHWARLLSQARRIEVFSNSSRDIVSQAYPEIASKIDVCPHALLSAIPNCPTPHQAANASVTIGVLGNLNLHKGAMIVDAVAQELSKSGAGRIVLLGETDPELSLKHIKVHGSYVLADLPVLVQKYNISKWLMPSIWPETFSFTTFEMIATGLPVYSFDMGAQADALRASLKRGGQGGILTKQGDFPDAQFIAKQLLKFHSLDIDETAEDK